MSVEALVPGFAPETDLERRITKERDLLQGLAWGRRRFGHPEGRVGLHVAAILRWIGDHSPHRHDLRLIAMVHDSFKHAVRSDDPWSKENDHAVLARRFTEQFVSDERILCAIELHDELYWIWHNGGDAIGPVLERVPDPELYLRFVELDASTEGKDPSFLWWVRHELARRGFWLAPPRLPHGRDDVAAHSAQAGSVYIETFATAPEQQRRVALAARDVVSAGEEVFGAAGEVLVSYDGLRVLVVWHQVGERSGWLLREGGLIRRMLREHPELRAADASEAHMFRAAPTESSPGTAVQAVSA